MSTCRFAPVSTESLMFQFLNRSRGLASSVPASATTTIVVVFAIVAALYFGREVLVPIALALLLSFVLAPIVRRLQSWRVPRVVAAVSIVAIFAFATIFGLGAFMVSQVSQLANDLPALPIDPEGKDPEFTGRGHRSGSAGTRFGCVERS